MTDPRQHFFSDRIVNKWNSLSEEIGIVSDSSVNKFKGKLQRLHNDGFSENERTRRHLKLHKKTCYDGS